MKKTMMALVALAALSMMIPGPAAAVIATSTHPYDNLTNATPVGGSYAGFTYDPGSFVFCVPFYNYFGYPPSPQSPRCVSANVGSGIVSVTADLAHSWLSVSGWCMTAAPFANPNGIVITSTDILGGQSRATCKSNYGAGAVFTVAGTGLPSTNLNMHDTANFWGHDHLVFRSLI